MNIAFVPIDNRPVCYSLARQICDIDDDIKLFLPDRELLGDLTKTADVDGILNWLENLPCVDIVIIALDTIAYGGLVPSRRCNDSFETIKERIEKLKKILANKQAQVYAFSSIMRISNNNYNEEEKEYWSLYGEKIFAYSYNLHKDGESKTDVPKDILEDYLKTRKRNFEINKEYLKWSQEGFFKLIVFSKDDCAKFGLNVYEANELEKFIEKNGLNALVKTGADEIPLSLLARAITDNKDKKVKIAPFFTELDYVDKISKYEDVSVYDSVKGQIELAGAEYCEDANIADIILFVNNFKEEQGELVMGVDVEGYKGSLKLPQNPFLVADIRNANGADNNFVKVLFDCGLKMENFLGYAGWNTTGNTLGSGLCCAIVKYLAENINTDAFKKVQAIRFLDDWGYQANIRKKLKAYLSKISVCDLEKEMEPYEDIVRRYLQYDFAKPKYAYPWDRFFEIEVDIK